MVPPSSATHEAGLPLRISASDTSEPLRLLPRQDSTVVTAGCQHHTPPPPRASLTSGKPNLFLPDAQVGPFIIGVTGASASGKTTVCEKIINGLGDQRCVLVCLDWFYRGLPPSTDAASYNFDHPDAFDFNAMRETLEQMILHKPVKVPRYDFTLHKRAETNAAELDAADVIIVEGILTFYDEGIRNMLHMKIFVEEAADICLSRRLRRDISSRGRTVDSVLAQYERFVKPSFEEFILPTKRYADLIVPHGGENLVAIDVMIKHIALKIRQEDLRKVYTNLVVMSDSYQIRCLHTIFRNVDTSRDDMVFYSNRLMRLLIEEALGLLPFEGRMVRTPTGAKFYGVGFVAGLAAVSLLPHGTTMEGSLRAVCNTVRIGKMLIEQGEKQVRYCNLPEDMRQRYVMVLAPVVNTGGSCIVAIERLLRKDVGCMEERIMVLSLIVSPEGVKQICSRYSKVRLVVSAIDRGLDAEGRVTPGVGDFAQRYYGCE